MDLEGVGYFRVGELETEVPWATRPLDRPQRRVVAMDLWIAGEQG